MDQKIAILGPKSWVHLWLDLGFRISKLAMRGGGKKKSVCCWKIWVRLIKCNKRRADHMRGSSPRPLSSVQLFHLRECERAAICWRAGFRQHKAAWNLSRDLYLFIPITLIHIHGNHSHYAAFFFANCENNAAAWLSGQMSPSVTEMWDSRLKHGKTEKKNELVNIEF